MVGATRWIEVVLFASGVFAAVVPTSPSENQTFRSGDQCNIAWNPDTVPDGWKAMRIDLVAGSQSAVTIIAQVAASVDATGSGPGSYSWTCPNVDFNGPVYSYMFTSSSGVDMPVFSSSFTITDFDGSIDVPGTSSSVSPATPTDGSIADPSNGSAHIGNDTPVPNSSSGEELLENIDQELGGADASFDSDGMLGNFIAQGIAAGPQYIPEEQGSTTKHLPLLAQATLAASDAHMVAVSTTTQTRMLTLVSVSTTSTAFAASPSHTATISANGSRRQTGSTNGATIVALFVLCAGHFFNE